MNNKRWKVLYQSHNHAAVKVVFVDDLADVRKMDDVEAVVLITPNGDYAVTDNAGHLVDTAPTFTGAQPVPALSDKELLECIPKVQLGKEKPVTMVWMQQREALIAMRAAIDLFVSKVMKQDVV